jgi:mRNA-degrading endonuclease RelE of RelBE toxin-antitoxin system
MRRSSGLGPTPSWLRGSKVLAAPGRGRGRAGAAPGGEEPVPSQPPEPWKLRYAKRILAEDLREIGHAAFENARKAIQKKLPVDPHQYGDGLRPPLDGIYKLKSSHVRVAYHIEEADHEVWVLMIADRSEIWNRHEDAILGRLGVMREEKRQREAGQRPGKDRRGGR